jgi:uncharacterized protein
MRRRTFLTLLLAPALATCRSPDPALYTLVPVSGTVDGGPAGAVALGPINVAHYLDRPQIVRHHDEYQLATDDTERWAEPLDEMIPRVLVEELTQRLPKMRIAQSSSGMIGDTDARLAVSIERFDSDPDGTVVLDARWSVRGNVRDGPLDSARITGRVAGDSTSALVAAMSACLGRLSDRLAAALAAPR